MTLTQPFEIALTVTVAQEWGRVVKAETSRIVNKGQLEDHIHACPGRKTAGREVPPDSTRLLVGDAQSCIVGYPPCLEAAWKPMEAEDVL